MLLAVLAVGLPLPVQGQTIQESFALEEIERSMADGLVVPESEAFNPEIPLNRGAFIRMLNGFLGLHRAAENQFADVPEGHPYYEDFLIARETGYISGFDDGTVQPDRPLSRQEAVVLSLQILEYKTEGSFYPALLPLSDENLIAGWSRPYMDQAVSRGYINLFPDGTVRPEQIIRWEEAVYLLARLTGRHITEDGTVSREMAEGHLASNMTLFASEVTLENLELDGDLIITDRVENGNIVLRNTTIDGRILVRGAGNVTITLWDSRVDEVQTDNHYGLTTVRRDSNSVIGNYRENTALRLDVVEAPSGHLIDTSPLRNPLTLLLAMFLFLLALLGLKSGQDRHVYFVNVGQSRRLRLAKLSSRRVLDVRNNGPDLLRAELDDGILVLSGLREGQAQVTLVHPPGRGNRPKDRQLEIVVVAGVT